MVTPASDEPFTHTPIEIRVSIVVVPALGNRTPIVLDAVALRLGAGLHQQEVDNAVVDCCTDILSRAWTRAKQRSEGRILRPGEGGSDSQGGLKT